MARRGWSFYDPLTDDLYVWPVNPHTDSGSHAISKNPGYSVKAGSHRNASGFDEISTIVYSTGPDIERFSYSGFVYTEDHLEKMIEWCSKDYAVELTEDLGRTFLIIIENFNLKRVRSRQTPWKHSYDFSGYVLDRL